MKTSLKNVFFLFSFFFSLNGNAQFLEKLAKKAEKAKEITEDELKSLEKDIQKVTDDAIKTIDKMTADKEKELLEV